MTERLRQLYGAHRATAGEFVRFCLTGGVNAMVDVGIYAALTRLFSFWAAQAVAASVLSSGVAVAVSFVLNNFWTFQRTRDGWQGRAMRFLAVSLSAMVVHNAVFSLLLDVVPHDVVAKIGAIAVGAVWNFTLYKAWAFKEKASF